MVSTTTGSSDFKARFFELSIDFAVVVGFDGYFKEVNEGAERALGYSREEFLSRPFQFFLHPEDIALTEAIFQKAVQGIEIFAFENRYVGKDGSIRWIQWRAKMDVDLRLAFAVGRDITERKQLDEELRRRETQYRSLVEAAQDLIWAVDKAARLTFVNKAAERIYGYLPEELIGRSFSDLSASEARESVMERFARVLDGEAAFQFETTQRRKDGALIQISFSSAPIYDKDGAVIGATGTASDITERKRAEERLLKQAEAIRSMATPIIQIWDEVVAMPIIGVVDSQRAAQVMEALLQEIVRTRTRFAILDLTGVEIVDTSTANYLLQMVRAVSLLGGTCIVSGISPAIASTMVGLGIEMSTLLTFGTLQTALRYAIRECGVDMTAIRARA